MFAKLEWLQVYDVASELLMDDPFLNLKYVLKITYWKIYWRGKKIYGSAEEFIVDS